MLKPLPALERKIWELDFIMNRRGVPIDIDSVRKVRGFIKKRQDKLKDEFCQLTGGEVDSPTKRDKMLAWLKKQGLDIPDLTKNTVIDILKDPSKINEKIRKALKLRQEISMASLSKFTSMDNFVCDDGRLRHQLQYHRASTGRFGGRQVQLQNMPSRGLISKPLIRHALRLIQEYNYEAFNYFFGDIFSKALKSCIRPMIMAPDGKQFVSSDYSSIEGITLAWAAGEQFVLDAFAEGKNLYILTGSKIYNKPYESIKKGTFEYDVSKIVELACGYGGSLGAFNSFSSDDIVISDDEKMKMIKLWRDTHPMTTAFWYSMEDCAKRAITKGGVYKYRNFTWFVSGDFLMCRMPSGRLLHYYKPRVLKKKMPWGRFNDTIHFMGMKAPVKGKAQKWCLVDTWGGTLTENVIQALSRDLLTYGMLNVEKSNYPIILTVHDEILSEVPEGFGNVEEFENIMAIKPPWAEGLPLKADGGWIGKRFRK